MLIHKEIDYFTVPAGRLAVHKWLPEKPRGVVFYFHGLQSHGGWLWETGNMFARRGLALICIDRHGCGLSDGPRGEFPAVDMLLDDYAAALASCRRELPQDMPVCLFGHCLGGSVLAALLSHPRFTLPFDLLVFCSSWLGKLHTTLSPQTLTAISCDESDEPWDAGLKTEDFTADPRYQRFINEDALATRTLTRRSRKQLLALEQRYLHGTLPGQQPAIYIAGSQDDVIDLKLAIRTFCALTPGRGSFLQLPADKHYLLFTEEKQALVERVSSLLLQQQEVHFA